MAIPVIMPRLGNTVETCYIAGWLKQKGQKVSKEEVICEIETDKATFEIEAPADGIVLDIFFEEGTDVPVLTNIAVIGTQGEDYSEFIPGENTSEAEPEPNIPSHTDADVPAGEKAKEPVQDTTEPAVDSSKQKISPRAKRRAKKTGLPLDKIIGTGPAGRIIERDIIEFLKTQAPLTPAAQTVNAADSFPQKGRGIGGRITPADMQKSVPYSEDDSKSDDVRCVTLKGIRKIIAERMLSSLQNSAQLTLNSSADARKVLNLRKAFKNSSGAQSAITINDIVHLAVIKALTKTPEINALLLNDVIEYHSHIHLGFAVDTERGLMVPVIKNADGLNLSGLSQEARRLAASCHEGKINPDELSGATFTVTNLGSFGIESFTPVLNLPQTAILGVCNINLKVVQTDFGIQYIPHIGFSLTIDHRVIDGAVGARFLQTLAEELNAIDTNNII